VLLKGLGKHAKGLVVIISISIKAVQKAYTKCVIEGL
jgi:hypothetical protein